MAYEFKRLSDVTLLDSVPNNATVLAEVDGAIRRVPGNGLGGGNSAGGYTVDYPETTYTFDGDLTGKESFSLDMYGAAYHFVRVGDCVDDDSRFIGQRLTMQMKDIGAISIATSGYSYDEDRGVYAYTNTTDNTDYLTVGAAVRVRWDGTLYECEVQDGGAAFGEGAFAIGNGSGFGLSGSDEPFLLVFSGSGSAYYALNDSAAGVKHEVTVYVTTEQTLEITADYIMDLGALLEGLYPVGQVGLVGKMMVFNIRADTEMGIFQVAMGGGEQVAPLQTVRQGLYACYMEQTESDSDITDPVTDAMWVSSVGVAAGTNTVELPEALTEVKANRLGGYWCKGVSLAWDGSTEGVEQLSSNLPMYRISDAPIPATLPVSALLVTETTAEDGTVTTEMKQISAEGLTYAGDSSDAIPVFQLDADAAVISVYEDFLLNGVTVRKGTYAGCVDTEADGTKTHTYVYMVTVESGWARWPEQLGGGSSVEIKDASETEAGVMKLYTALGSNTDGAVTQKAVNEEISSVKSDVTTLQGDVSSLQGDVSSLQGDVSSLQGDVSSLQGDVTNDLIYAPRKVFDRTYANRRVAMTSNGETNVVKIVAVHDKSACYSPDVGSIWEDISNQVYQGDSYFTSVAYGAGKFVVILYNGETAYSDMEYPHKDWEHGSLTSERTNSWIDIAYGSGKFVAVRDNSSAYVYSEDGVSWTEAELPLGTGVQFIIYTNDRFFAWNSSALLYSADGINWTQWELPDSTQDLVSIVYGNGKYLASTSSKLFYSVDCISWTEVTFPDHDYLHEGIIAYGNGMFVVANRMVVHDSNGFHSSHSYDGINWVNSLEPVITYYPARTPYPKSVLYVNGVFIEIEEQSPYSHDGYVALLSTDGRNWDRGVFKIRYRDSHEKYLLNPIRQELGMGDDYVILASSTAGSSKKFKVTVDDSGTLTATEITS